MSNSFDGIGPAGLTSEILTGEHGDPQLSNLNHLLGKVLSMRDRNNILRFTYVYRRINGKFEWTYGMPIPQTRKYDLFRDPADIRRTCLVNRVNGEPVIYWYAKSNDLVQMDLREASEIEDAAERLRQVSEIKDVIERLRHVRFWITLLGWVPPLCKWYLAFADE